MYNLQSKFSKYFHLVLICLITLCATLTAFAADLTIAWDTNTESDLAGYKLFYGTSSKNYDVSVDVGNTTTYTIANLAEGIT